MTLIRRAYEAQGLDSARHCIAVTGEENPMDNPAKYLHSFYMFDSIGGRYSSTSMVGVVMLGFALEFELVLEFLAGASSMDEAAEEPDLQKNLASLAGYAWGLESSSLGASTVAVHPQQCNMESNGRVSRYGELVHLKTGPIFWGEPGTNGQHAFYQLLH